jgi:regulator of protease activity HflC (stomatin/prohibitin superfamily)
MIRLLLFALIIFLFFKAIQVGKPSERLVVLRVGGFLNITGPGMVVIIPLIDRGVKINMEEKVPGWQALTEMEFRERLKTLAKEKIL